MKHALALTLALLAACTPFSGSRGSYRSDSYRTDRTPHAPTHEDFKQRKRDNIDAMSLRNPDGSMRGRSWVR